MIVSLFGWILVFGVGVLVGAGGVWIWCRGRGSLEKERLEMHLEQALREREADAEKLKWAEEAAQSLRETFEALASRTLRTNSEEFLKRARDQMGAMLEQVRGDWKLHRSELQQMVDPIRKNLDALDGNIRTLEQKREGAYQGLEEQLRHLAKTHTELQTTTVTLAQALKSPTVRGRWGEVQLRRVVEMAGMVQRVAFEEHASSEEGGRPDMTIHLPNGGVLPVDAKVPLEAYLEAMEENEAQARKAKLASHARAVQGRVRDLGQKKYWDQFEKAPDFVAMFVPVEACLGPAFESDPELFEYAIKQRVLIVTPVTLLALLKTVAYGWQQHQVTENARQIALQGRELYTRLEKFVGHLADLRKDLNKTVDDYNSAVGSLERRLLPSARRFQEMGIADREIAAPDLIQTQARLPAIDGTVSKV